MTKPYTIKLDLSKEEKAKLRRHKFKMADVLDLAIDELEAILEVPFQRARKIKALAEFQIIPSIGIRFAEDLIFLGYYSLDQLKDMDGAKLVEEYEKQKGFWIDSCVEDQFRLVVHHANNPNSKKVWWDFTSERKQYRQANGYPNDRPKNAWHE